MNTLKPGIVRGLLMFLTLAGAAFAWAFTLAALNVDLTSGASQAWITNRVVRAIVSLILASLAAAVTIGGRFSRLSVAFFCFAISRAAQPPVIWLHVLPAPWHPIAQLVAAVIPAAGVYGFVTLCLRMPNGDLLPRWRVVSAMLPFYCIAVGGFYAYGDYRIFSSLIWLSYAIAFAGYLDRRREATGDELLRSRWVAGGIGAHVAIEGIFLPLNATGHTLIAAYVFALNPAPYAFAYAFVRRRIVDIRVFGGRAVAYALLTSIPVCLLALTDWFFAKELEDAKLATIVEVVVAVAFSFWLQSVHRRIDAFVERVFFARRHRAHTALEELISALPHTSSETSIDDMLVRDVCALLELDSAALYRTDGADFVRARALRCDQLPERADADHPLILYARSSERLVRFDAVGATSDAIGVARVVPIVSAKRIYGVIAYGEHSSGEPIDAEEDQLLVRLGQAAAAAYEHHALLAAEREVARMRSLLPS